MNCISSPVLFAAVMSVMRATKFLVAVFLDPDDVVRDIACRVRAIPVFSHHSIVVELSRKLTA